MNVIIANEKQEELSNLDTDIIKSVTGSYEVVEIVEMFRSFFYSKMILDVTAIKNYKEIHTYQTLVKGLDATKIILLLPEGSSLCTPNFLGRLISLGIYNFTTNLDGIKYLLKKPNSLEDVEHILKMTREENIKEESNQNIASVSTKVMDETTIVGFRNATDHAGATTFIYILKKELSMVYGKDGVVAVEIGKSDFSFFNDKNMISVQENEIQAAISKLTNAKIILVDLNNSVDDSFCGDIIYLLEPTTLRLNKLIRRNPNILKKLKNYKIVLNQSLLLHNDVIDFQSEAGVKVFYNMPPLDERKRNAVVNDFLQKLGLISEASDKNDGKIFGLFRR